MKGLNNLLIDYPLLHIFGIFMEFSIVPSGSIFGIFMEFSIVPSGSIFGIFMEFSIVPSSSKWYTVWSNSFSLGKYGI